MSIHIVFQKCGQLTFTPVVNENLISLHESELVVLVPLMDFSPCDLRWYLIVKNFFMCLVATWIILWENLYSSIIYLMGFFLLSSTSTLYILYINSFQMDIYWIISPILWTVFVFQSLFHLRCRSFLIYTHVFIFAFTCFISGVSYLKMLLISASWRALPKFISI